LITNTKLPLYINYKFGSDLIGGVIAATSSIMRDIKTHLNALQTAITKENDPLTVAPWITKLTEIHKVTHKINIFLPIQSLQFVQN
jgi:hypothetical protein